jgi:hypothetical protein
MVPIAMALDQPQAAEYRAELERTIASGWLWLHESRQGSVSFGSRFYARTVPDKGGATRYRYVAGANIDHYLEFLNGPAREIRDRS